MTRSHVVINVLRKPILSGPLESDIVTVRDMSEIAAENKVYSGNSPQMAAPRRSREIDQSTQCFHVGCDNRCLLGNEYGGLHRREFLGRTFMILILTNQVVCVTLSVIKIPPLAQPSLF